MATSIIVEDLDCNNESNMEQNRADYLTQLKNVFEELPDLDPVIEGLQGLVSHCMMEEPQQQNGSSSSATLLTPGLGYKHSSNSLIPSKEEMDKYNDEFAKKLRKYDDEHIGLDLTELDYVIEDMEKLEQLMLKRKERIDEMWLWMNLRNFSHKSLDCLGRIRGYKFSPEETDAMVEQAEQILVDTMAVYKSKRDHFDGCIDGMPEMAQEMHQYMVELRARDQAEQQDILSDRVRRQAFQSLRIEEEFNKAEEEVLASRERVGEQLLDQLKAKLANLETVSAEKQEKLNRLQEEVACLDDVLAVKCEVVDHEKIELGFGHSLGEHKVDQLQARLTFHHEEDGTIVLRDVEMSESLMGAEDLIRDVKRTGDLPVFVRKMELLWKEHVPLMSEIAALRNKYAIDWWPETRTLEVMLAGNNKNTVATLVVPPTYPFKGKAALARLHGGPTDGEALYKLCNEMFQGPEDKTLTQWLIYLQKTLS